jgi:anthranilate phosphoribosyltransferase
MSVPPANALQGAIQKLAFQMPLSTGEAEAAFEIVMRGQATAVQVAALLAALRATGESAEVVAGVVRAMRGAMVSLSATDPDTLVDTCGTGGGAVTTFNISTAAALVAAGAGVRIAKHGNRSFTSRCGSADVLEALGVPIEVTVKVMEQSLVEAGIVFMFAPLMHPAMRHVGPVRRELGIPTVMNIVGPLANPAGAGRQVVGVADLERAPVLAGALAALGTRHALVVHGEPGLDEVSPLGPTHVIEVRDGTTTRWTIHPEDHGFKNLRRSDLAGNDPVDNARVITEVLAGGGPTGARAAVILNAAAAIYVSGISDDDYQSAVNAATKSIETGKARDVLERLRRAYANSDAVTT